MSHFMVPAFVFVAVAHAFHEIQERSLDVSMVGGLPKLQGCGVAKDIHKWSLVKTETRTRIRRAAHQI